MLTMPHTDFVALPISAQRRVSFRQFLASCERSMIHFCSEL